MHLTAIETSIIQHLRSSTITTVPFLRRHFSVSRMTLFRALRKIGYFSSFNHNSAFYVLADVPRFDAFGLWWHDAVGFTRYLTLQATVLALTEASQAGCSVAELQTRLRTPVANLLSRLSRLHQLSQGRFGRAAVYFASDARRQAQQRACRDRLLTPAPTPVPPSLPPNLPTTTILDLLVQVLRTPTATPASLSQTLQARAVRITADQVRLVFAFYDLEKKRQTLALARLVTELTEQSGADIRSHGCLPDDLRYIFDSPPTNTTLQPMSHVYKTANRTVVSLHQGRFEAHEIVRRGPDSGNTIPQRSAALAALVPSRMRYDFDLIAFVGLRSFLGGRCLTEVQQELAQRSPALDIPLSSLHDLRLKFLFFYGALHRQNAPKLRTALAQLGPGDWLIDGTLEPGSPLFFGIQETHWGVVLGCWKLPSENAKDLAPCLKEAADQFGSPRRIIHDLGAAMALACEQGLHGVPHRICHFHFANDVGEDLYQKPQRDLSSRLRALGLQVRMHDQRKGQTEKLRVHVESGQGALVLSRQEGCTRRQTIYSSDCAAPCD